MEHIQRLSKEELKKAMKEDLESRKKQTTKLVFCCGMMLVGFSVIPSWTTVFRVIKIIVIGAGIAGIIYFGWQFMKDQKAKRDKGTDLETLYAEGFLKPAISKFMPDFTFEYWEKLNVEHICPALLPGPQNSNKQGNCFLKGTIKGYNFAMSNYQVTHETTDSDGDRETVIDFVGQVYEIECPKMKMVRSVRIIPTKKSILGESKDGYRGKRKGEVKVETENIEFNENYDVIAENETDARYVLSPQVIENLCAMKRSGKRASVVFIGNRVYVGDNYATKQKHKSQISTINGIVKNGGIGLTEMGNSKYLFSPPRNEQEIDALDVKSECIKAARALKNIILMAESLKVK